MSELHKYSSYFSGRPILSKGALFNLVMSDRSDGKTFDFKARALEDYRKDKSQHLFVRRYSTEFTSAMINSFFDEVVRAYPDKYGWLNDYQLKCSQIGIQIRKEKGDPWDWLIYFCPLTKSGKLKSNWDVERITEIDFDEYIPLDGRYLKDEMTYALELYKSVDRDRYTTQMLFAGNKISPFCPFFSFFQLDLSIEQTKIRLYREGTVCVQVYACAEHREHVANSPFAKMVAGTSYDAYNQGGLLNPLSFKTITLNPQQDRYICSFITDKGKGSIWQLQGNRGLVISNAYRKDGPCLLDRPRECPNPTSLIMNSSNVYTGMVRSYYEYNQLFLTAPSLHPVVLVLLCRSAYK